MSVDMIVYLAACGLALLTLGLRLTRWNSQPRSRSLTIALTLLTAGVAVRHPALLESDWLESHTAANFHLANFTDLMGDLLIAAAAGYVCTLVAKAWGFEQLRPWIFRIFTADAMVLVVLWAISDAPHQPTKFIGSLGGPALIYSYVAGFTVLISNLAVLGSIAIARLPRKTRLALIPMALGATLAVLQSLLRIGSHAFPDAIADLREEYGWHLVVAIMLLYTASGLIGYLTYTHAPRELSRTDQRD